MSEREPYLSSLEIFLYSEGWAYVYKIKHDVDGYYIRKYESQRAHPTYKEAIAAALLAIEGTLNDAYIQDKIRPA